MTQRQYMQPVLVDRLNIAKALAGQDADLLQALYNFEGVERSYYQRQGFSFNVTSL